MYQDMDLRNVGFDKLYLVGNQSCCYILGGMMVDYLNSRANNCIQLVSSLRDIVSSDHKAMVDKDYGTYQLKDQDDLQI